MKITGKNGSDFRPIEGKYSTTTLIELTPNAKSKRVPSNIVFLLDASSSMQGEKWKTVKEAVSELLKSLKDDDRVALVLFDSNARTVFPLASLAQNRETMIEAINKLEDPYGVTNLEQGLKAAYGVFDARSKEDRSHRVNHIILLTDGFPTDNQGYRVEETSKYESVVGSIEGTTLTGIGIGSAEQYDASFISRLSDLGKGSYYHAQDLEKFKKGMQAELSKLNNSVVGEVKLQLTDIKGTLMRIAKVAPEIVLYDPPGNVKEWTLAAGSLTKDTTSFLIQTNSNGDGVEDTSLNLFKVFAEYDGKKTEEITITIKTTTKQSDLGNFDSDVMRSSQSLQVFLNGEQIRKSIESGEKEKATRLIQNTTKIAQDLGQASVTKALTRLEKDVQDGKSGADELATLQDESKKTKLLL